MLAIALDIVISIAIVETLIRKATFHEQGDLMSRQAAGDKERFSKAQRAYRIDDDADLFANLSDSGLGGGLASLYTTTERAMINERATGIVSTEHEQTPRGGMQYDREGYNAYHMIGHHGRQT